MVADDVFELAWASDPRLSPDGRQVAYVVTRVDRDSNAYRSAIFTVPVDGSSLPRNVTAGEKADAAPRWSPDGTRLAFTSNRTGTAQLYVVPVLTPPPPPHPNSL